MWWWWCSCCTHARIDSPPAARRRLNILLSFRHSLPVCVTCHCELQFNVSFKTDAPIHSLILHDALPSSPPHAPFTTISSIRPFFYYLFSNQVPPKNQFLLLSFPYFGCLERSNKPAKNWVQNKFARQQQRFSP